MRKYVYLIFALFFALSACQEEVLEDASEKIVSESESIVFTFIYKGEKYQEVRSSATDPFQNKVIERVLSTDNYSIFSDPNQEDTFFLFDTSEDAKRFLIPSENARCATDDRGNIAYLALYKDKNYNGTTYAPRPSNANASQLVFEIDNNVNTFAIPKSIRIPNLGVSPYSFNDETSSMKLEHNSSVRNLPRYGCERKAIAILYLDSNYLGRSLTLSSEGSTNTVKVPDLSKIYFYDFFGIDYGSTWNNKISSLEFFLTDY